VSTNSISAHADDGLFVVHVREQINMALAGHDGCEYTSPPQTRPDALALVAVLLSGATHSTNGVTSWTCAIAGGRRTITLATAPDPGRPAERNGHERPAA
jgi:hypothetical protein